MTDDICHTGEITIASTARDRQRNAIDHANECAEDLARMLRRYADDIERDHKRAIERFRPMQNLEYWAPHRAISTLSGNVLGNLAHALGKYATALADVSKADVAVDAAEHIASLVTFGPAPARVVITYDNRARKGGASHRIEAFAKGDPSPRIREHTSNKARAVELARQYAADLDGADIIAVDGGDSV